MRPMPDRMAQIPEPIPGGVFDGDSLRVMASGGLRHAFGMGEFERGEAGRITGLPERTARNVLGELVAQGLLVSDSPKGKVRAGFPVHALGSLLPNLYPAGDVDIAPLDIRGPRRRKR